MAATFVPRIVRETISKGKQGAEAKPARVPREGGGGGGAGMRAGFGSGQQRESGDAAVTGNYERMPYTTFYGFPIAGGGLTDKGKEDKASHDQFAQLTAQYGAGLQQGLKPEQALLQAARGLPGGVSGLYSLIASHPDAQKMLASADALHQRLSGEAQKGPQYAQVQGKDGKIYNVQQNPDGSISNPQDVGLPGTPEKPQKPTDVPTSQRPVKGPEGQWGTWTYGPNGQANFHPANVNGQPQQPAGAKAPPVKGTSFAQSQELNAVQIVLGGMATLKNNLGATGSLGYGWFNRKLAENTPLSGTQAQAYNAAYNQIAPALLTLTRTAGLSSQNKAAFELLKDQLPDPTHANLYNMQQVLPRIEMQMRMHLANIVTQDQAENRPGRLEAATAAAKTFDANPKYMQDLQQSLNDLRTNPGKMSSQEVSLLNQEGQAGRLPYDDWLRTQRQAVQRGFVSQEAFGKLVETNPDLKNFPDNERVTDPSMLKPMPTDQVSAGHTVATQPKPVTTDNVAPPPGTQGMYQTGPDSWASNPNTSATVGPAQPQPQPQTSATNTGGPQGQGNPGVPVSDASLMPSPGSQGAAQGQGTPPQAPQQPPAQQGTPGAPQGAAAPIAPAASAPMPSVTNPATAPQDQAGQTVPIPPPPGKNIYDDAAAAATAQGQE